MKLYYTSGACSLAVRIALYEMGIPCEFESVNLKTKQTETGNDFLKISRKGAVPTLTFDDGTVLTENTVIQQYLAEKYQATQLLPPPSDIKRYRVLEWLNYVSTDLHKTSSPLFNPNVPDDVKENIFKPILKTRLNFVNEHLSKNKYLLNEQFTLADGYLFVVLSWLKNFKLTLSEWPHLQRYFGELKKRKSIQQALRDEHLEEILGDTACSIA